MSLLVTLNGQNYIIPQTNEVGWGSNLDDFFVAIPAGVLQKTGGSFTLSAETDFGATYGLKSVYYKSRTANVASAGQVRLASADTIQFRNNGGGGDIAIDKDSSDNLRWNATKLLLSGAVVNADINAAAAIAYSKLALSNSIVNADINSAAAIAYSKLALTGAILNADINASAAIAYSKLALTGTILDADVNASAAIAYSKLNLGTSIVNADINASAAIVRSKLAATETADLTFASGKGFFLTDGTSNTVKITAPTSVTTYALKLPTAQGGSNQYLTNDGSGNLSWTNAAGTGTVNSGTATNLGYYATSTNAISNAGDLYYDSTNHRFGVNLAAPSGVRLYVAGPSGDTVARISSGAAGSLPVLSFVENAVTTAGKEWQIYKTADTTNSLNFWNNGDRVIFNPDGTVSLTGDVTLSKATAVNLIINSTSNSPVIQLQRAATTKSRFGIADSASSLCAGTAAGDLVLRAESQKIFVTADGGTTAAITIDTSSNSTFAGSVDTATVTHSTGVAVKGTTTNDSATAGFVGEVIESKQTVQTSVGSSTAWGDLASISLTAGNWLIYANAQFFNNGATTVTDYELGISVTSGNSNTGLVNGDNELEFQNSGNSINPTISIVAYNVKLSGTTIHYLKYASAYTGTAPKATGRITAVRIR